MPKCRPSRPRRTARRNKRRLPISNQPRRSSDFRKFKMVPSPSLRSKQSGNAPRQRPDDSIIETSQNGIRGNTVSSIGTCCTAPEKHAKYGAYTTACSSLRRNRATPRYTMAQHSAHEAFNACEHRFHRVESSLRLPRNAGRGLIWIYRHTLSPLVGYNCRHLPTCSVYGDEAIGRFGLWAGGWMTLARLLRCHPFGTSGHRQRAANRAGRAHAGICPGATAAGAASTRRKPSRAAVLCAALPCSELELDPLALICRSHGEEKTMRWKISPRDHVPKAVDPRTDRPARDHRARDHSSSVQ